MKQKFVEAGLSLLKTNLELQVYFVANDHICAFMHT